MSATLDAALKCAERGWRVLPVHTLNRHGSCTCGKKDCGRDAGKHPATPNGKDDATADVAVVGRWDTFYGEDKWNLGVRTGAVSGLLVLDVDPDKGGAASLARLQAEHEPLPATLTVRTGSGGHHYYFRHPGFDVRPSAGKIALGLDIRADDAYVVAPPSRHRCGGVYQVELAAPVVDAPGWLLDLIRKSKSVTAVPVEANGHKRVYVPGQRGGRIRELFGKYNSEGMRLELIKAAIAGHNEDEFQPPKTETELSAEIDALWKLYHSENGQGPAKRGGAIISPDDPGPPATVTELPKLPLECLPAQLTDLADHLAGIWGVDPALYAVPGLAVLSTAIGNGVRLALPGGASASALLWLGIVARTGAGKTPAAERVRRPLMAVQAPLDAEYARRLADWKAMSAKDKVDNPRPELRQVIMTDSSWEAAVRSLHNNPGGILWWRDELLGIWRQLLAFSNRGAAYGDSDALSAWVHEPIRRQRVTDGEVTIVPRPYLPIFGGIQPRKLSELGTNDAGKLARLLPYRTDRWPEPTGADPEGRWLAAWDDLVTGLATRRTRDTPGRSLTLDMAARELWLELQQERLHEMREADEETAEYIAKLDQHAGRFATIRHVAEHAADGAHPALVAVTADTVRGAWELARCFLAHQLACFKSAVPDFIVNPDRRAELVAVMALDEWVAAQGGRARSRDAQRRGIAHARTPAQFNGIVGKWVAEGLGHVVQDPPGPQGGKPAVWLKRGPKEGPA